MLCDRLSGARARHAGMSYIFEQRESVRRVELITEQGAARPDWAPAFPVPVCDWTVEREWTTGLWWCGLFARAVRSDGRRRIWRRKREYSLEATTREAR